MATYAIGDIQGCYQSFIKLLNLINFDPNSDQLWLAGDMINRGPESLKVMTYIIENQSAIRCVLGNHDLHFLAVAHGCKSINLKDTFTDILESDSRNEIVKYLSQLPLVITDKDNQWIMAHAGIYPSWSAEKALSLSKEVMEILQSSDANQFYQNMYGNIPSIWEDTLTGFDRLRTITNIFTRMRYLDKNLSLELTEKNALEFKPSHLNPWFEFDNQDFINKPFQTNVIFGHWASLNGQCSKPNHFAVDTGCVWSGKLTALRLHDKKLFQV
ncbi:MAG: diadenosine tetraphosphatase [Gammaproteobacteria bacterium]|nr:MAG: diadenosine tetraphosphatase [Gammaproteobacteria bacterium]